MQQLGHVPRKTLGRPNAFHAAFRIAVDAGAAVVAVEIGEGVGQTLHITRGQIQTFGAGGRHNMGGVARQKQAVVTHRLTDKTAQRRNAFFQAGTGNQFGGGFGRQAVFQLLPEAFVRPIFHRIAQRHLQVIAAAGGGTLAAQGKAVGMFGVNQFFRYRRGVGEQTQPAEGVHALVGFEHIGGYALARHAVEAVAAGDKVAIKAVVFTVVAVGDIRCVAVDVVQRYVFRFVNGDAAGGGADIHQISGNFGLAVHHHVFADFLFKIHADVLMVEHQFHPVVHQAFAVHSLGGARFFQTLYRGVFQHTGADAAQYVFAAFALQNHIVDTVLIQQLAEQQAGRAGADNGYLGFHDVLLCLWFWFYCYECLFFRQALSVEPLPV